ncbi:MAG: hypothetical protein WC657_09795, partial [Candidatus Paceibacterota bacterium]
MKTIIFYLTMLCVVSLALANRAQSQSMKTNAGGSPDPQLSQKDNDYLDRQAAVFLDTVKAVLAKYPPVVKEGKERSYAKLLLDAVFHEKFAAFRKPAQDFFHTQNGKLIKELETAKITRGARIWKIYDMGFIVRTKTITIAFDLVSGITSGSKDFALSDEMVDNLVKQCDILFISHKHADHAEKAVAARFIAAGKPVVSPEQVWRGDTIA